MQARFPHATVVSVSVTAGFDGGTVLDVESGDASAAQAPGWVLMRRRAGVDPSVYCDASTWPAVQQAFADAGVTPPHYWIASYDGDPTIPAGAVAKQYASNDYYDTSSVSSYWPGVDPAPTPPSPPTPPEDIVTPQDIQNVAAATVAKLMGTPVWEAGDAPDSRTFQQLMEYLDQHYGTLLAQITALSAAVNAVAKDEVTAAEVKAAVTEALAAAGHPPVAA
jgi:hypothetical protein